MNQKKKNSINIGIVPARMGSKGVPRKNMADLGGKPLLFWTLEAALDSNLDVVYLSTEDREVAEAAQRWVHDKYGRESYRRFDVLHRPQELASDIVQVDEVVLYCLRQVENLISTQIDTVTILQPTSPFRTAQHIDEALAMFELRRDGDEELEIPATFVQSLVSVNPFEGYLWERDWEDGYVRPLDHEPEHRVGRQMKAPSSFYVENGAIYIVDRWALSSKRTRYVSPTIAYRMYGAANLEIDSEADLARAREYLEREGNRENTL